MKAKPFLSRRDVEVPHRVTTDTPGPSMTKQSFKDSSDINVIMRSYQRTGLVVQRAGAEFMDLPDNFDYHEAATRVLEAQHAFARLPAAVRDRFGNSPSEILTFLGDEKNREEAVKLGLIPKPPVVEDARPPAGGGGNPPPPKP